MTSQDHLPCHNSERYLKEICQIWESTHFLCINTFKLQIFGDMEMIWQSAYNNTNEPTVVFKTTHVHTLSSRQQ